MKTPLGEDDQSYDSGCPRPRLPLGWFPYCYLICQTRQAWKSSPRSLGAIAHCPMLLSSEKKMGENPLAINPGDLLLCSCNGSQIQTLSSHTSAGETEDHKSSHLTVAWRDPPRSPGEGCASARTPRERDFPSMHLSDHPRYGL